MLYSRNIIAKILINNDVSLNQLSSLELCQLILYNKTGKNKKE